MLVRSLRQEVSKQLASVRSGETSKVDFPKDLSSEERKYIHQLAQRFGISSKSSGAGADRYLTVTAHHKERQQSWTVPRALLQTLGKGGSVVFLCNNFTNFYRYY